MPQGTHRKKTQRRARRAVRSQSPHVVSASRHAPRANASFSVRRAEKASRREISSVVADSRYVESAAAYGRRVRHQGFVEQTERRLRTQRIVFFAVVAIVAVVAACAVGRFAFVSSVDAKIALGDDDAIAALAAPDATSDAYYVLFAGEYSDARTEYSGPGLLLLVRIDPVAKQATVLDIPPNIELTLSDGQYHALSQAQVMGGDAYLIEEVESLVGIEIAHYVKTDAEGFQELVDTLGGIEVDVPQEVDDPDAGTIYLSAGTQTLDGASALVLCRADNYSAAYDTKCANQEAVFLALMEKLLSETGIGFAQCMDGLAQHFKTDLTYAQVEDLLEPFRNLDEATIYTTVVPGSYSVEADGTYFSVSRSSLSSLMDTINAGGDPTEQEVQLSSIDTASITVTVKNGAGTEGAATEVAAVLAAQGFQVPESGNADSYIYDETLVIYKDAAMEAVAEAIVNMLGCGRAVDASIYYSFETDLQVVIGKDYQLL